MSTTASDRGMQVRVKMRDGVELAADLSLPDGSGPFPTLVTKTPYDREFNSATHRRFFASNGYAVLVVSVRGRFDSGGTFFQSRNEGWLEHKDGYDTIEWAAEQPWSNGKVGTFGTSAGAQWQFMTAPTRPPHLLAMSCGYPGDHRVGGRVERGIHILGGLGWHYRHNAMGRPIRNREDYNDWLAFWKSSQLPLLMTFLHPEIVEAFVHTAYDDYWRDSDPGTRYPDFDVPVYHEGGWYDRFVRATFRNFNGIRTSARSESARQAQKLIIGAWVHGGDLAPETETVKFGPQAPMTMSDRLALRLRWFDYWLKGVDTGVMKDPAVRLYVIGAERWLESDTWPLPDIRYVRYYLGAGRTGFSNSLNDGRLALAAPASDAPDLYTHDPYDPIPAIGGHGLGGQGAWPAGPLDQRVIEPRILTYTTDVLEEDTEVVGEIRARFFASSSAVDTDFVLTLSDVYPNGYAAMLRQNAVRARYRLSEETESLLEPNKVYEFTLTLDVIANLFKAGHRVRLAIASSSFPAFLPNPGTATPIHLETKGVVAQNAIYHDSRYPSAIEVPIRHTEV